MVEDRKAHVYCCVKKNQPTLFEDIKYYFSNNLGQADYTDSVSTGHGRIEQRKIWTTSKLNEYVKFPHVAKIYRIERTATDKKSGETSIEVADGITSRTKKEASPKTLLHKVRDHWSVEAYHYIIDWIYNEDRSTIRTGYGPENMTRMRRFAIGLVKSKGATNVSKRMRQLDKSTGSVLDYFKLTTNTRKSRSN